jgi:hypothetical protein
MSWSTLDKALTQLLATRQVKTWLPGADDDFANPLVLQPDGKLVAAGEE